MKSRTYLGLQLKVFAKIELYHNMNLKTNNYGGTTSCLEWAILKETKRSSHFVKIKPFIEVFNVIYGHLITLDSYIVYFV